METVKFNKGKHFEEKIVQALIVDHQFSEQMMEVLDVAFFNVEYLRKVSEIIFGFYDDYRAFPTFKTLVLRVKDKVENELLRGQIIQYLLKIKEDPLNGDAEYIKEESLDFCKKRSLALALEESLGCIEEKKFDQIVPIIQKALVAGSERDIGHIFLENDAFEERMQDVIRDPVPTPWPEINEITQGGFAKGELWTIAAPTGCHGKGEKVLMDDGSIKKVEDVVVGDKLKGPNSCSRTVQRLIRGTGKLYEVSTRWGYKAIFNESHTLALQSSVTKEHVEITIKDYVNSTPWFKHTHFWYQPPEGIQFAKDQEKSIDPYILGLLLGDGYLTKHRIEVTTADKTIVEELQKFAEYEGLGLSEHKKKGNTASGWYFTNSHKHNNVLVQKLERLGLLGRKSGDKFIPKQYLTSSMPARAALLAGLIDSDGYNSGQGYELVTKSSLLAKDIAFLARSLGCCVSERQKIDKNNNTEYHRLFISGPITAMLPIRLKRKQITLSGKANTRHNVCKFDVREVGQGEYFGFTVDKDNLYLSEHLAVIRNCGKSHFLVDVGHNAALLGCNVVHYTLELSHLMVGKRYDARFSGVPFDQLLDYKSKVREALDKVRGDLTIKYYPPKTASALTLKSHIHKLAMKDKKPDLILVDYGDLMRSRKGHNDKRFEEEAIYEELRTLAGELQIPVVTATQTNRSSLDEEIITLKHVAECFQKAMISDVFITIMRRKQNSLETPGNFFVAKNRLGPDGIKLNIMANTSISKFRIIAPEEAEDEMDPEDRLRNKFKEFQKKSK